MWGKHAEKQFSFSVHGKQTFKAAAFAKLNVNITTAMKNFTIRTIPLPYSRRAQETGKVII